MLQPLDLKGRTILITGASSGIGRATAVLLSQLGAKLVLVARNVERLTETKKLTGSDRHHTVSFDLNNIEAIPGWMKQLIPQTGPLYGLIHSAGLHLMRPVRMVSLNNIEQQLRINLIAGMQLAKGFRQRQVCQEEGSIVFLSSVMGIVGQPGVTAYSASKGGLNAFVRSLALELASESIRVNCVAPGHLQGEMQGQRVITDEQLAAIEKMHPLGIGRLLDVAHAIAFLVANTGRWITGTTLVVDGGYTAG